MKTAIVTGASGNLGQLARYLTAFAPESARSWTVVVAGVVAVASWVVVSRRSIAVAEKKDEAAVSQV